MDQRHDEKRGATRVACDLPILMRFGPDGRTTAELTDLSRLGICIRVPGEILGVHRLSSLVQVARQVSAVLGPRFDTWLGGGEGGVKRTLEPVRICQRNWESRDVELGCALSQPLDDADLERLGMSAPPIADPDAVQTPLESKMARWRVGEEQVEDLTPLGASGESEPHHVGYMVAQEAHGGQPIQGTTQIVTGQDAILVVPAFERTRFAGLDIASMILALGEAYGDLPTFSILHGPRALWSGPVRLTEVEIPASGMGPMRLRIQFEDPLSTTAREALGAA